LGTENIIHSLRLRHELHPEEDIFTPDADNAFNTASRAVGLHEVQRHFPGALSFLSQMYAHDSRGWIRSRNDIYDITCAEGYHQGDCLASWLFCLTIQPLLKLIKDSVGEEAFVKFFIDDGNIAAKYPVMKQILDIIVTQGPDYGFKLKINKGTYMIGRCATTEEALQRKQELINRYGFDESIIRLHPDNNGDPVQYGCKVLGSFIGNDEYCHHKLQDKMIQLVKESQTIIDKVDLLQTRFLILRWSFSQKIVYWLRTMRPEIVSTIIPTFTELKYTLFASILGCEVNELDDRIKLLTYLQLQDGGVGLMNSVDVSRSAYLASFAESYDTIKHAIGNQHPIRQLPYLPSITSFKMACRYIHQSTQTKLTIKSIRRQQLQLRRGTTLQHWISSHFYPIYKNQLEQSLTTPAEIAWYTSACDKNSGLWLDISPKSEMHQLSNTQFQMALRLRLFMPQKRILPNTLCNCKRSTPVDLQGLHWCTGCNYDGVRINTHNLVRDQIAKILRYCGVNIIIEEQHAFAGNNPDTNRRPDLTAFNLPTTNRPQVLDVQLTSPCPPNGGALTMAQAQVPLRAANKAAVNKERKYRAVAPANNLGFIPLIFETTGRMHSNIDKLLHNSIKAAAINKGIPFEALWKYWISSLMIVIQRGNSDAIVKRSEKVNGNFVETYETSSLAIMDFD